MKKFVNNSEIETTTHTSPMNFLDLIVKRFE